MMFDFVKAFFSKNKPNGIDHQTRVKETLFNYSQMIIPEILMDFGTSREGLVGREVKERLEKYGLNEISYDRPTSWYHLLYLSYLNPFNILVTFLGIVYYILGDIDGTIIIASMVTLSVGIRFIQELRSNIAAEKLKAMVSTKATVIRRGDLKSPPAKVDIPMKYLVPGDIVFLSAGDMLPADMCLICSKELFVSQSALTGEAMPVEKYELPIYKAHTAKSLIDAPNICFTGTNVLNGTATGVIVATGNDTFFGSMAKNITGYRPQTSFDVGINQVSWLLIRLVLILAPLVLLINGITKDNWFESLLFSLSVAVGLIPEMLPMIVTTNLAKGAVKMAQSKVIVKHLNSIQNFGAMDVLCTDKTGTLTQDHIILEKHLSLQGEDDTEVLQYGYLNSYYQTGLKNLLDLAVLEHTEIKEKMDVDRAFPKVDEIPYDFVRRRMSIVVQKNPQQHLLICKGAVEEMLSICTSAKYNGSIVPLTEELQRHSLHMKDELNEDGLRVLAVAYKELPVGTNKEYKSKDEQGLTLIGFLAFLDPPKKTAQAAIAELNRLNVQVKVLTGDTEIITKKICKWVGLNVERVLNGNQIDAMDNDQLKKAVEEATVFAKMSPQQKARVICMLKANGHTVGYLGDGINDAAALRAADVGISVDTAVDIAKESADIIMLEKSLLFLQEAVVEGRNTFGNIIKYIKMAVSSNFGNVFSVLGASMLLPFLPMLPLQMLIQNLLYDISQVTIPFDTVDREFLEKPRQWNPKGIVRFMLFIGPISSIFDYTTFALMWFVFAANSIATQSLFQTGWFVEGLLTQTFIVHMIRTRKIPFIQSIASLPLLLTTALVMAAGIYIPYSFIGQSLEMVPLPSNYFYWLTATLICYAVLVQIVKVWFIKKFSYWL